MVRENVIFDSSGEIYRRPDWINFGFGNGGTHIAYPHDLHQASAGEELPVARSPIGVKFKPGEESFWAGKGDFYILRYGPYLIAMNMNGARTFELQIPHTAISVQPLQSSQTTVTAGSTLKVGPRSTVVLYLSEMTRH